MWLMFSLRTGELVTAELMFLKEVLEVVDSFPAREIIAMCMNSDWSGSTYIMEHEPDKYDSMYTEYFFRYIISVKNRSKSRNCIKN